MKKALLILLVVGLLAGAIAGIAIALGGAYETKMEENAPNSQDIDSQEDEEEPYVDETTIEEPEIPMIPGYNSVKGEIKSIEENDGIIRVTIEDENDNPAVLVLNENTVYPFAEELNVGDVVTGWYKTDAPMIMIWPAEYNIAVLVAGAPEDSNIKVDRFSAWEDSTEDMLISQDGMFAFRTDENTEIALANGDEYTDGNLEGRRIVVIYDISTRGIPETTTALRLIVLYEDAVTLPG